MPDEELQLFGGNWTERKLAILAAYLKAYNNALKKTNFTRVHIDAFAGTGYRRQSGMSMGSSDIFQDTNEAETQEFLKGSARLALEVEPPFDRYIFIESDARKVAELRKLGEAHPDRARSIEIVQADANDRVREYCRGMPSGERAVVFLDPFATQVHWETVKAISATRAIDAWILFPIMAVNRLLANDPKSAFREALDRVFGTRDWFERFYGTRAEKSIFGQSLEVVERRCDIDAVGKFYLERLKGIFAGVASRPRAFLNSKNSLLFQLFFAAANEKGAPIAVRIANHLLENL